MNPFEKPFDGRGRTPAPFSVFLEKQIEGLVVGEVVQLKDIKITQKIGNIRMTLLKIGRRLDKHFLARFDCEKYLWIKRIG